MAKAKEIEFNKHLNITKKEKEIIRKVLGLLEQLKNKEGIETDIADAAENCIEEFRVWEIVLVPC